MAYSLLAHLYPHIRGSQEDIATYSLQYLLVQSKELNRAWDQDEDMIKRHDAFTENKKQIFWGLIFLALEPLQNSTFSEVCEDIKKQIEKYLEILS